jgi:hypothetical protein
MRALIILLVLAGCQKDFEERYAETEARVKAAEARLDAEMAKDAKAKPQERPTR